MFGHNLSGMYIAFEGVEGSGKSEQIKRLRDYLNEKFSQRGVVITREPGGTRIGEQIRTILHDPENATFCPIGEVYGYATARAQSIHEVVFPALLRGDIVLTDRTFLSSLVHQGFAGGLGWERVWKINEEAVQGIIPDLIIYQRITIEEGFRRKSKEGMPLDRMELKDREYHQRCFDGYEFLATKSPFANRFLIVDGTLPKETIMEIIWERVRGLIEDREATAELLMRGKER